MAKALSLLGRMRLWAQFRRVLHNMRTVRGALLVLFGLVLVGLYGVSRMTRDAPPMDAERLEWVRQLGPWILIVLMAAQILLSPTEGAVGFSAAEVNFLFPAPFSRRQLLIYKIEGFVTGSLLMAMVLPGALRSNGIGVWYPAAFLGCALALLFMQLGQLAVVLLAGSMGTQKFTRRRKIVLGVGAALLLVAVIQTGKAARDDGLMPFLARLSETVVGEVLLFPFRSLVELILAQQLWPDVAAWLAAALAVNGAVLWLALVLDAHYLEVSAEASERVYARQQLLRQGMAAGPLSGTARWTLPSLPRWGGVGTLLWRQLTTAGRCWSSVVRLVAVVALFGGTLVFSSKAGQSFLMLAGLLTFLTSVVGPPCMPFDFRGDVDRLEFLKTLPLPPTRVAMGQVLVPALLASIVNWLVLAVLAMWRQEFDFHVVLAFFLVPFAHVLLFGLENLVFLWFPTRMLANPGDIQQTPKVLMFASLKMVCLGILVLPALLVGVALNVLAENAVATAAGVFVALVATDGLMLYLVGRAFRRFDVAHDMPA